MWLTQKQWLILMTKKKHSVQPSTAKRTKDDTEQMSILGEDIELISPGAMLREARNKLSLSQDDIANKLNFKVLIVANIEQDIFDNKLPATYNRGYLTNYAKLVAVDVKDVLASYDLLNATNNQRSELQSFSKQTVKEAEHSRVMWFSYLILIVLVGLTALWWQQDNKQTTSLVSDAPSTKAVLDKSSQQVEPLVTDALLKSSSPKALDNKDPESTTQTTKSNLIVEKNDVSSDVTEIEKPLNTLTTTAIEQEKQVEQIPTQPEEQPQVASLLISHAVFTFSGDCWVNIYDATGERIAWGIKKSGYVMNIEGVAPLRITLGKPELASIIFNEQSIDMSTFNRGNIAKFTLPLVP